MWMGWISCLVPAAFSSSVIFSCSSWIWAAVLSLSSDIRRTYTHNTSTHDLMKLIYALCFQTPSLNVAYNVHLGTKRGNYFTRFVMRSTYSKINNYYYLYTQTVCVYLRQELFSFVFPHSSLLLNLCSVLISLHLQLSDGLHQLHTGNSEWHREKNTDTNNPQITSPSAAHTWAVWASNWCFSSRRCWTCWCSDGGPDWLENCRI